MKMDLDADIDNIPFLLYMKQQEAAEKPPLSPYNGLNYDEDMEESDE